jgi:hypothetical protein
MKSFVSRFTVILIVFAAVGAHANQAVLNADQVLEIDGKKIFVICFSLPPPVDGKAPNGKNAIAELADAGATFLRAGTLGGDWLRTYNAVSDIAGVDIYPIAYPPGRHSQFVKTNAEMSMVGDYARLMMEVGEKRNRCG